MWGVGAPKIGKRDNEDGTISKIGDDQNGGDNPGDDPSSSRRLGNKWGGGERKNNSGLWHRHNNLSGGARVGCRSNDCQMDKPREGKLTIIIGTIIMGEPGRPKDNNDHNNSNGIKRALLL